MLYFDFLSMIWIQSNFLNFSEYDIWHISDIRRCIQSPWIIVKIRYAFVKLHIDVWLEMVTSTCNSFSKDRVWSRSKPCIQFDIELAICLLFLTVSPSIISFESLSRVFWNKIFDDHLFLFFRRWHAWWWPLCFEMAIWCSWKSP